MKKVAPAERLGSISKQGNSMARYLLVEAAQSASICDPELRRDYQRLKFHRGSGVAKVAIARLIGSCVSSPARATGSHAGHPGPFRGRRKPIVFLMERPASFANRKRSSNRWIMVLC